MADTQTQKMILDVRVISELPHMKSTSRKTREFGTIPIGSLRPLSDTSKSGDDGCDIVQEAFIPEMRKETLETKYEAADKRSTREVMHILILRSCCFSAYRICMTKNGPEKQDNKNQTRNACF